MAETAGLIIGAVALAGIFHDCLDIISDISTVKSMGRDAQILNTKLDVEKTLFLQWAERIHLIGPDHDPRLHDRSTAVAVNKVLGSLRTLLNDSSCLRSRYGLQERAETDTLASGSHVISENRMAGLRSAFEWLRPRRSRVAKRAAPWPVFVTQGAPVTDPELLNKIRWVAVDKEKFEKLVDDLSYFVSKLNELVPPVGKAKPDPAVLMAHEDILYLSNTQSLLNLVSSDLGFSDTGPEHHLVDAAKERHESLCFDCIMKTLWFRRINDRRMFVSPAHSQTLEWALKAPGPEEGWADLSEWFKGGSRLYWISGKAGCGKSTLMRHLYDHAKTKLLLSDWAAGSSLITACFFFYYLGNHEQKTFEGLSRTLLYHILESDRSRIPELLPEMWQEVLRTQSPNHHSTLEPPTRPEVEAAFKRLSKFPIKICLFIDGLDECSGKYHDGISLIKLLSTVPNIKVLVSSRPEPDFVAAFSISPMLRMQDLTKGDMRRYVTDIVASHPQMKALLRRKGLELRAQQITVDLVEKAEGIFLWIVLACRSLLDGFAQGDLIAELERRIAELPEEIGDMFSYMFRKVDKNHRAQGAKYLRICYDIYKEKGNKGTDQGLLKDDILPYDFPVAGMALLDEYYHPGLMGCSVFPMPASMGDDLEHICATFASRLSSRCGGLLEVRPKPLGVEIVAPAKHENRDIHRLVNSEIVFIHRTVVEFLLGDNAWDTLEVLDVSDKTFHPAVSLSCLWMYVAQITRFPTTAIAKSLRYAHGAIEGGSDSLISMLLDFQQVLMDMDSSAVYACVTPLGNNRAPPDDSVALILAVELGIVNFIPHYFDKHQDRSISNMQGTCHHPLLHHAISQGHLLRRITGGLITHPFPQKSISYPMVQYLLKAGCRALECYQFLPSGDVSTPWETWLGNMEWSAVAIDPLAKVEITELFLSLSVDRDLLVSFLRANSEELLPRLWAALLFPESDQPGGECARRGLKILRTVFGADAVVDKLGESN